MGLYEQALRHCVEFVETKTEVISAWWNSHIVTDNNQYTKEEVVTSTVEVLVAGQGTLDAVAREGL